MERNGTSAPSPNQLMGGGGFFIPFPPEIGAAPPPSQAGVESAFSGDGINVPFSPFSLELRRSAEKAPFPKGGDGVVLRDRKTKALLLPLEESRRARDLSLRGASGMECKGPDVLSPGRD